MNNYSVLNQFNTAHPYAQVKEWQPYKPNLKCTTTVRGRKKLMLYGRAPATGLDGQLLRKQVYSSLSPDDVIHQRHRPGKSCTNPVVRAGKVTSAPNTSIYGYIN